MGRRSYCKGLLLVGILFQSRCFMPYVLTQAHYQLELIKGAKPVSKVVLDPKISEHDRQQLLMIQALKRFSVSHMGMNDSQNYSAINPTWRKNLYVVSASKELSFEPYIWNFPIIGRVPYLGHFDHRQARAENARLKAEGYDTMLRAVSGYSTLGYFNDPIWPQMLKKPLYALAELILHELAHATLWFNGQADFNESFANFAGQLGAKQFLERNFGKENQAIVDARNDHFDSDLYSEWLIRVHDELEEVYKSSLSDSEKRERKKMIIEAAQRSFTNLQFRSQGFKNVKTPELNNAVLVMSRRYNTGQDDFAKLFALVGNNWTKFYERLRTLQNKKDPFLELSQMVK